jgi:MFS family permease
LATATAFGGAIGPIAIGTGGLVGLALLPESDRSLATLPVTAFIVGSALASIPAALSMRRIGRRAGFMSGALIGAAGAAGGAVAIVAGSFLFFCLALVFMGAANAFGQQYRFAAADASVPAFKAKAISWVLAGGVVTGVVGPQIAIHGQGVIPAAPLAGPFAVVSVLLVLAAVILSRLDVPPPPPMVPGGGGRPVLEILFQSKFLVALLAAISSYALMSFVMTATPIAMIEHHHQHSDAQLAIQWHVIAMFGPSFFSGGLVARYGKARMAALGLVLIALAAVIALSGTGLAHFWIALVFLGIGWNFGFIASTAMVAELYRPEEAFRVQAMNEFLLFGIVAIASFSAGKVLVGAGWEAVNWVVFPIVAATLLALLAQSIADRRRIPVATPD